VNDLLTWWEALGTGEQIFWGIAVLSNALFIIYVVMQFFGGHDGDVALSDGDSDVAVLSVRSLLAFGMFLGWTGIVMRRLGFGWTLSIVAGLAAGLLAVWLAYRLLRILLGLQSSGTLEVENAVGKTGHVHLSIPPLESGSGRIMVEVQGALRELEAVSADDQPIANGTPVLVVGLTDEGLPIVQPFHINDLPLQRPGH
jgi:membrane protein implicated in regulation of membrane protease activity